MTIISAIDIFDDIENEKCICTGYTLSIHIICAELFLQYLHTIMRIYNIYIYIQNMDGIILHLHNFNANIQYIQNIGGISLKHIHNL